MTEENKYKQQQQTASTQYKNTNTTSSQNVKQTQSNQPVKKGQKTSAGQKCEGDSCSTNKPNKNW